MISLPWKHRSNLQTVQEPVDMKIQHTNWFEQILSNSFVKDKITYLRSGLPMIERFWVAPSPLHTLRTGVWLLEAQALLMLVASFSPGCSYTVPRLTAK